MSVEEDPLLNSISRTRRSVEILALLNKATCDTCKVYLLHLNSILNIGLPLKEPDPKFADDHAAVCKGIHDFALQTHHLANQFEIYSKIAFSHLLQYGVGLKESSEAADNRTNTPAPVNSSRPLAVSTPKPASNMHQEPSVPASNRPPASSIQIPTSGRASAPATPMHPRRPLTPAKPPSSRQEGRPPVLNSSALLSRQQAPSIPIPLNHKLPISVQIQAPIDVDMIPLPGEVIIDRNVPSKTSAKAAEEVNIDRIVPSKTSSNASEEVIIDRVIPSKKRSDARNQSFTYSPYPRREESSYYTTHRRSNDRHFPRSPNSSFKREYDRSDTYRSPSRRSHY